MDHQDSILRATYQLYADKLRYSRAAPKFVLRTSYLVLRPLGPWPSKGRSAACPPQDGRLFMCPSTWSMSTPPSISCCALTDAPPAGASAAVRSSCSALSPRTQAAVDAAPSRSSRRTA